MHRIKRYSLLVALFQSPSCCSRSRISLKIPTIGIVRGEEWEFQMRKSPTLTYCQSQGMILYFISRDAYQEKKVPFPYDPSQDYLLPKRRTNALAIEGCKEILNNSDTQFDTVCCCVGTGGTLAGLIDEVPQSKRNSWISCLNASPIGR